MIGQEQEPAGTKAKLASRNGPLRVGIGGPVGAGKTSLTEALCRYLASRVSMAVITNDIYTREDADYLMRVQALPAERIRGVETGGCPTYGNPRGCIGQSCGGGRSACHYS